MKKIFTLLAASFLTVASFAADRRPSVTLKTSGNYEVVIDGKSYSGNRILEISRMRGGQHSIRVYEQRRGFFSLRAKRLVSVSTFQLGRNDLNISIDFRGQIRITEERSGRGWNVSRDSGNHDRDGRNDHHDRDNDGSNDHDGRF